MNIQRRMVIALFPCLLVTACRDRAGSRLSEQVEPSPEFRTAVVAMEKAKVECETNGRENASAESMKAADFFRDYVAKADERRTAIEAMLAVLEVDAICGFQGYLGFSIGGFLRQNPSLEHLPRLRSVATQHRYYWTRQAALRGIGGLGRAAAIEVDDRRAIAGELTFLVGSPPQGRREADEIADAPAYEAEIYRQLVQVLVAPSFPAEERVGYTENLLGILLKPVSKPSVADSIAAQIRTSAFTHLLVARSTVSGCRLDCPRCKGQYSSKF